MFRDRSRLADPDQPTRNDVRSGFRGPFDGPSRVVGSTVSLPGGRGTASADDAIVCEANLLPHGRRMSTPEISLVAAIFEDAVRCVQLSTRGVTHQQSLEAFEWMASERRDWPFAFVNVCDLLGMDAAAVRTRLGVCDQGSRSAHPRTSTICFDSSRRLWHSARFGRPSRTTSRPIDGASR
jgi:hypothetical protein